MEIIGELKAAKEVGGDLYDYLDIHTFLVDKYDKILKIPKISEYKIDILFGFELFVIFDQRKF